MDRGAQTPEHSLIPIWSELVTRTNWFIALRWLAVAMMIVAGITSRSIFQFEDIRHPAIYILAGCLFLCNTIYWFHAKSMARKSADAARVTWARIFYNIQISIDLIILTILIHYTGGHANPIAFFYVFHVIIASILLSRGASIAQATLATVLFTSMAVLEHLGVLADHPQFSAAADVPTNFLIVKLAAFASMLYVTVYLATSIMDRLRMREEELDRTWREVRALEAAKSRLMRTVAHELRSPSAAVESMLRAVLTAYGPQMDPNAGRMIERSIIRVKFLTKLVNDLLIYSRQQALQSTDLQAEPFDLTAFTGEAVETFRPQAQEQGVELRAMLDPTPEFLGEAESFKQVLNNLISNAVRYTPRGGTVDVTLESDARRIELSVSDTGIGISAADQERIFEEFHRAANARKLVATGTGLGLAIVKTIVERHGGSLTVESTEGEGSTFRVILPIG